MTFLVKKERYEMTAALAEDLRVFAVRKWPTMNHKWRKAKLASMLRMSERRIKSLYEADPSARVRHDEVARIQALISAKEEATHEDRVLEERIAALEAQIAFLAQALAREGVETPGLSSPAAISRAR